MDEIAKAAILKAVEDARTIVAVGTAAAQAVLDRNADVNAKLDAVAAIINEL